MIFDLKCRFVNLWYRATRWIRFGWAWTVAIATNRRCRDCLILGASDPHYGPFRWKQPEEKEAALDEWGFQPGDVFYLCEPHYNRRWFKWLNWTLKECYLPAVVESLNAKTILLKRLSDPADTSDHGQKRASIPTGSQRTHPNHGSSSEEGGAGTKDP